MQLVIYTPTKYAVFSAQSKVTYPCVSEEDTERTSLETTKD